MPKADEKTDDVITSLIISSDESEVDDREIEENGKNENEPESDVFEVQANCQLVIGFVGQVRFLSNFRKKWEFIKFSKEILQGIWYRKKSPNRQYPK